MTADEPQRGVAWGVQRPLGRGTRPGRTLRLGLLLAVTTAVLVAPTPAIAAAHSATGFPSSGTFPDIPTTGVHVPRLTSPLASSALAKAGPSLLLAPHTVSVVRSPAWDHLSSAVSPSARAYFSMAPDPSDSSVLLFGGSNRFTNAILDDTWLYKAGVWTNLTPSNSPPALTGYGLTYDASDGYDLLFGGSFTTNGTLSLETWTFSSDHWTQLHPAVSPPPRGAMGLAYDPGLGEVLLFGGQGASGPMSDTWTFHAGSWVQQSPATSPTMRGQLAMNYDPSGAQMIVFGGNAGGSSYLGDTWALRGGDWSLLSPTVSPVPRAVDDASTYDPIANAYFLFGGYYSGTLLGDTWSFSSGAWANISPAVSPGARVASAMAYDTHDGYIVMFGGNGLPASDFTPLGDTWAWAAPNVTLASAPATIDAGQSVTLSVSGSSPGGTVRFAWSPLPAGLGCPTTTGTTVTCTPTQGGTYSITVNATDSAGAWTRTTGSLTLTVNPALRILSFSASPGSSVVGQNVSFAVMISGGTSPYSYHYTNLPGGCVSQDLRVLNCTPTSTGSVTVTVNVTDAVNTWKQATLTFNVSAPSQTTPSSSSPPWLLYAVLAAAIVAVVGAVSWAALRRRRHGQEPSPPELPAQPPPPPS